MTFTDKFCNNCGKQGHYFHQCRLPITSCGVIAFTHINGILHYLMICRKHTLGFMDFVIGKYNVYDKDYILSMFHQMTQKEKQLIATLDFNVLWEYLWGNPILHTGGYKSEEMLSRDKFKLIVRGVVRPDNPQCVIFTLASLIIESNQQAIWLEPEWGFPKGRKNHRERDFECAIREFNEETGYNVSLCTTTPMQPRNTKNKSIKIGEIENLLPMEEIFIGSNHKAYKHRYFIAYLNYEQHDHSHLATFENDEVSHLEWKTYEDCFSSIRSYNIEKKDLIQKVHYIIQNHVYRMA